MPPKSQDFPSDANNRRRSRAFRREGYELRGRRVGYGTSVCLNETEAPYNRRSSSLDLDSGSSIEESEGRAADAFAKLQNYDKYDSTWREIRDDSLKRYYQLTFEDFPWPTFETVHGSTFLQTMTRETVLSFLFDPLRIHTRGVDEHTLRGHEKINWVKDRPLFPKVTGNDLDIVRTAYDLISLYVHDERDEDVVKNHEAEFKKRLNSHPSPVRAFESFPILCPWRTPTKTVPRSKNPYGFPPTPVIGSPTGLDFLSDDVAPHETLFSQDTIIVCSSPPMSPHTGVKEDSFGTPYRDSHGTETPRSHSMHVDEDWNVGDEDIVIS